MKRRIAGTVRRTTVYAALAFAALCFVTVAWRAPMRPPADEKSVKEIAEKIFGDFGFIDKSMRYGNEWSMRFRDVNGDGKPERIIVNQDDSGRSRKRSLWIADVWDGVGLFIDFDGGDIFARSTKAKKSPWRGAPFFGVGNVAFTPGVEIVSLEPWVKGEGGGASFWRWTKDGYRRAVPRGFAVPWLAWRIAVMHWPVSFAWLCVMALAGWRQAGRVSRSRAA